jgi:hypothetical protein
MVAITQLTDFRAAVDIDGNSERLELFSPIRRAFLMIISI